MNLQMRFELLSRLGEYLLSEDHELKEVKVKASLQNSWFTPQFIDLAIQNICTNFLEKKTLQNWIFSHNISNNNPSPKNVGLIMAGNLPLVGFHDFLSVFISGNKTRIKPSSKDEILIKHVIKKLEEWEKEVSQLVSFKEMLKGCDAYIATGSNNSSRYFEYYFAKYPHIIRHNRTSVAILEGNETKEELESLADDVYLFFGRGCRNVTKIYVPVDYNFIPLIEAFKKYNYLSDHHKYKNNYDYNLAIHILNRKFYMTNESIILLEDKSLFSPVSQLNYEYFTDKNAVINTLKPSIDVQCIVGHNFTHFGQAQYPSISDFADGIDTLNFLTSL